MDRMLYPGFVDSFAADMKNARQDRLLTLQDVARKMGVNPNQLWEWEERGVLPTPAQIVRLAKLLGIEPPNTQLGSEWKLV